MGFISDLITFLLVIVSPAPSNLDYYCSWNSCFTLIPTSLFLYWNALDFCLVSDWCGSYMPGLLLIFLQMPYQNLGSALIVLMASLIIDFSTDSYRVQPWCSLPGDIDLILSIFDCPSSYSSIVCVLNVFLLFLGPFNFWDLLSSSLYRPILGCLLLKMTLDWLAINYCTCALDTD